MKLLKGIYNWTNGKKTLIGVVIHFTGYGLKGIGVIDQGMLDGFIATGDAVMAGGLTHKGIKLLLTK